MDQDRTATLLADLHWLHALARRLAADPDTAADAVQDTCALALQNGAPLAHPRAWLGAVLRNCLRIGARSRRAAAAREANVARPDAAEPAADLVQRAELQRRLVGAVLQLPPPHRDALLLRFFDGLPPRAIAARLQVPVATVHSRLQRGLQSLRQMLDRDCGGRAAWAFAFAPLPWPMAAAATLGGIMSTHAKLALVVLLAAGAATWYWTSDRARDAAAAPLRPAAADGSGGGGSGTAGSAVADGGHRRVAVPPAADGSHVRELARVHGRVCDADGRALVGVPIAVRGADAAPVPSSAVGAFDLDVEPHAVALVVADERWVTVLAGSWEPQSHIEPVVVAAPRRTVAGRVVDGQGAPIAGAQVLVQMPDDLAARLSIPLDRTENGRWLSRTGADGAFRLPSVPGLVGSTLLASAPAFRPASQPLPPVDDEQLQLVLQRFAYEQGQLDGVVVDPAGAPVAGALVTMGVTSVVSDADGRFGLLLRRAGWPTAIVAAKAGYLPGRLEIPRSGGTRPADWPSRVELRLGPKPLSTRGRVVDADGKGIAGAIVWATDPTRLGIVGIVPVQLEYLLAGGDVPPQAFRQQPRFADDPTKDWMFVDHATNAVEPSACWYFATADAQGDFELPGLLPREYTLRALDVQSGVTGDALPTPAGAWVEIRIARAHVWPELRGRVASLRGEPMPGCRVRLHVLAFGTDERVPGGRFQGMALREGGGATTGDDGAFVLRDVGSEHAFLTISGDAILPRDRQCKDIADPRRVVIEVEARCHVEVALTDPGEADQVAARDAAGNGVDLAVLRANSNSFETELPLHDGRSGVFVLSERATRLLLLRRGAVVREVPLQLEPGKTQRVQ
jgi:RNA polymerase sigma-70 factor (ECF subfamily)